MTYAQIVKTLNDLENKLAPYVYSYEQYQENQGLPRLERKPMWYELRDRGIFCAVGFDAELVKELQARQWTGDFQYNSSFRCWSDEPSAELMEATSWKEN